ncbi:hypothetical protein FJN13_14605 [Alteromonas mediterranea]|uniref:SIR2 family protein n=1 Tax=Alteromonas mediterranea TaxID=314275 RepID=UPI000C94CE4A|nr:SIR2 family protein [Alteromonas mediterranea]MAG67330.1 hypothetical protein [Pseudomonadales bacterium]QDG35965.1 hypothetical protein FJN13_14605 [Alteromonas mediterranea]|tara:strand:+ start:1756 stop:3270 length:1515 start_codon:yes stop_codon:yes gene_type:complete
MIIDQILQKIDEGGPKSYYSFETFILHLFKSHLAKQNKPFETLRSRDDFGDAFAPEGFDDFQGATILEIKLGFEKMLPSSFFVGLSHFIETYQSSEPIANLIVLSSKPIHSRFKEKFLEQLERYQINVDISLWGPEEINKIASKNRKVVNNISNNLFSLRLESVISKPKRNWKLDRDDIISELRDCYKKGQFSLFLGAGVSSSAGMPDWNTLLNSLFVTYLTKEFDGDVAIGDDDISELVNRLNSIDEPSALMAARYLRKGLSKRDSEAKDFIEAVTKNLYRLRNKKFSINSDLIKSIAAMCLPRRTGAKVKSVVTYNFDDLLERQLANNAILHRCIYTENESYDPDELPIYHVHGYLPENRKLHEGLDNSTLVFSEEGYHHIYTNSYHWSNLVQLNSFREYNCLMVGLSMTDPNLRRLLDISSKNLVKSKHYAFMKRLSSDDFCHEINDGKKISSIENVGAAEKFLDRHHTLNEELMKELGVTILWYESYDEIPTIIEAVSRH